jgi:hypothetical protein
MRQSPTLPTKIGVNAIETYCITPYYLFRQGTRYAVGLLRILAAANSSEAVTLQL